MISNDDVRAQQRIDFTVATPGWLRHKASFERASSATTAHMVRLARVSPGDRVLDLACGSGNPAFALAEAVGPRGRVLGLDLAETMVQAARDEADRRGAGNAEFATIEREDELGVADSSFDAATCRAGLQYMPEPGAAIRAIRRALKPGGRFVALTIGSPDLCMPYRLQAELISRHAELTAPDPAAPGPVGLSSPEALRERLGSAGFSDVTVEVLESGLVESESPSAYWTLFEETAVLPLQRVLGTADDGHKRRQEIREDAVRILAERFGDGPVRMTGEVLIAAGVKEE
ncbi:class I SAM-dependent methyltransferase [Amycolatopsis silviterrae]|uniref:Class I SAM-dependent methyltransferase n=1 Tax=Amycolatopsis silviterrae TaxID=1656914 RepID=A0ABW5HH22_9PSEU